MNKTERAEANQDAWENETLDEAADQGRIAGASLGAAYQIVQPDYLVAELLTDRSSIEFPCRDPDSPQAHAMADDLGIHLGDDRLIELACETWTDAAMEAFEATLMRRAMAEIGWAPKADLEAAEACLQPMPTEESDR